MSEQDTILDHLKRQGISRRSFLKFCTLAASSMALPLSSVPLLADALGGAIRPRVIWISGQECTGCSESLLRSYDVDENGTLLSATVENMILNFISLEYHNTLMAPSGTAAEHSRDQAIADGGHVVVIDGSIPLMGDGAWSCVGGRSALDVIQESVANAGLVVAVGNCASFGGLPKAEPNPTSAFGVWELVPNLDLFGNKPTLPGYLQLNTNAPLINIPGCPPVPEVMTGVLVNFILTGQAPELDGMNRPLPYYGQTVHEDCSRKQHYKDGQYASSFDGIEAQQGYCLMKLGCKGTLTSNACTTTKWNKGTSYPMFSGHGCLGCSEPGFWDQQFGDKKYESFYAPIV